MVAPAVYAIVARSASGVIGIDGHLPWDHPEDLQYFKRTTMHHPMVMGRRTWESIGRPLPGRTMIVVSRTLEPHRDYHVCSTIHDALLLVERLKQPPPFFIGGAQIYDAVMPLVTRLYVTEVAGDYLGDVYFPPIDEGDFAESRRDVVGALTFRVLDRVRQRMPACRQQEDG